MVHTNTVLHFCGPSYDPGLDSFRLTKQHHTIRNLMIDGEWRTLSEIAEITGYPESSISAQLRHLRKLRFGSHIVEKRRRGNHKAGCWEYSVTVPIDS